jgi:hypothetical protein
MENILKTIFALLVFSSSALAQIPALKDGELIVVDSILSPSATLESAELEPLMLNIIKLNINQSKVQPKEITYEWEVTSDGEPIPFLVGLGGNYIGFTFREANTINVESILHATYEVKNVSYEEVEGGLFKKVENLVLIDRDLAVHKEYEVDNDSRPDPDVLDGYAKQSYDKFYQLVLPRYDDKTILIHSAHEYSKNLNSVASRIAAGIFKNSSEVLKEIASLNQGTLKELEIPSSTWSEFSIYFQNLLFDEYENNRLNNLVDYQKLFEELAKGLGAVK